MRRPSLNKAQCSIRSRKISCSSVSAISAFLKTGNSAASVSLVAAEIVAEQAAATRPPSPTPPEIRRKSSPVSSRLSSAVIRSASSSTRNRRPRSFSFPIFASTSSLPGLPAIISGLFFLSVSICRFRLTEPIISAEGSGDKKSISVFICEQSS